MSFAASDRNTMALFESINNNLEAGFRAQAAANANALRLSQSIREINQQDKQFKLRLSQEVNRRKIDQLNAAIDVKKVNAELSIQHARLAGTRAEGARSRANAMALSGKLDEATKLHQEADRIELDAFSNLETGAFTLGDLKTGIVEQDAGLLSLMEEAGIDTSEFNQPINGLDDTVIDDVSDFLPDAEQNENTSVEPTPKEKLEVIKGGREPYKGLTDFKSIETQQDLDEFARLAGIDASTKSGQFTLSKIIPQTTFGENREKQREQAKTNYLQQSLLGNIGKSEEAFKDYEALGGSRAAFGLAQGVGDTYRKSLEGIDKAREKVKQSIEALESAMFQAKLPPNTDLATVDAAKIKDSTSRKALGDAVAGRKENLRALALAQKEFEIAERNYVQFQIDSGIMSEEDVEDLREAQQNLELATREEEALPTPEVAVRAGSGETSLSDFTNSILGQAEDEVTGDFTQEQIESFTDKTKPTAQILGLPADDFAIRRTESSLNFAKEASLENLALNRATSLSRDLGLSDFSNLPQKDNGGFALPFGSSPEEGREFAVGYKKFIKDNVAAFNALSTSDKKAALEAAKTLSDGKPDRKFQPDPFQNPAGVLNDRASGLAKQLGLSRNYKGNIDPKKVQGNDLIEKAVYAISAAQGKKLQQDISRIDTSKVDFEVLSNIEARRELGSAIRAQKDTVEILTPEGPPLPTEEEALGELSYTPETLASLKFPEPKASGTEGDVEKTQVKSTVPPAKAKETIKNKTAGIEKNSSQPINGSFTVLNKTRDQIPNFDQLRRAKNVISMDFNHDGKKSSSSKALVVIPNDASPDLVKAAKSYVNSMSKEYGIPIASGGRNGPGVRTRSENGRGLTRVTHLEGFFGNDRKVVDAIKRDPNRYANIIKSTFGQLKTAVFIPPHEQKKQGAATYDNISETKFALKYVVPYLS